MEIARFFCLNPHEFNAIQPIKKGAQRRAPENRGEFADLIGNQEVAATVIVAGVKQHVEFL